MESVTAECLTANGLAAAGATSGSWLTGGHVGYLDPEAADRASTSMALDIAGFFSLSPHRRVLAGIMNLFEVNCWS